MTFPSQTYPKITEFALTPIDDSTENFLGYYVTSTAPIDVDAEDEDTLVQPNASLKAHIKQIAEYLVKSQDSQIIISIHGYANNFSDVQARHEKIYKYAKEKICKYKPNQYVFLGYRWPAENPIKDKPEANTAISILKKLSYALKSLPTMLIGIFISTLVLSIITTFLLVMYPSASASWVVFSLIGVLSIFTTVILLKLGDALKLLPFLPVCVSFIGLLIYAVTNLSTFNLYWLLVLLLILFVSFLSVIIALISLRLSTYLRDGYRAINYGVPDLVELIKQLDQAITEQKTISVNKKIKLSFIGHSLGCLVITNTIRILSNVFDQNPTKKNPSPEIGRFFSLGRLILVAPDIPIETIMTRRANFLRSSLRRCEEAYVFSNEGDLALRLASTAANYFSFPAKNRFSGYRLGNLTAKHFRDEQDRRQQFLANEKYGVVNFKGDFTEAAPCNYLEVRASNQEHRELIQLQQLDSQKKLPVEINNKKQVADLFTYFDCTDYKDFKSNPKGVVSFALRKSALNFWDYGLLSIAYFLGRINVHGGYFDGNFSQKAMYQLAFLGFKKFLESCGGLTKEEQLNNFHQECAEHQIQVVLAPERYEVDILGKERDRSGY